MQRSKRPLRNISNCFQCSNIFNTKEGDPYLVETVPQAILRKIGTTKSISCNFISQLPPFQIVDQAQQQVSQCIKAKQHQLTWHTKLLFVALQMEKPTKMQQKQQIITPPIPMELQQTVVRRRREKKGKKKERVQLWQDSKFLQQLNEIIMQDLPIEKDGENLFQQ